MSVRNIFRAAAATAVAITITACGGGSGDDDTTSSSANNPPSIAGNPPASVMVGEAFFFQPQSSDPDGDALTFTIQNRPSWVDTFDQATGRMEGTPAAGDVGRYEQITLVVSDGELSTSMTPFAIDVDEQGSQQNRAPVLQGSPPSNATVGTNFAFTPSASDPDGDALTFSASNVPSWLTFNANSGQLSGTPSSGDIGTYNGISITVSDGSLSDSLTFSVAVNAPTSSSITLTWQAPTQNTDGSPLSDLTGYAIYYGVSPGTYPNRVQIDDPGLTRYVLDNLTADTYYFVAVAVNAAGEESAFSNEASKTIQ